MESQNKLDKAIKDNLNEHYNRLQKKYYEKYNLNENVSEFKSISNLILDILELGEKREYIHDLKFLINRAEKMLEKLKIVYDLKLDLKMNGKY